MTAGKPNMVEPQADQLDYMQVKEMLESSIAFVEKKVNVTLEDDFFVNANIRVRMKNRDRPRERYLISEQDTSQENLTDEIATFFFKTSFQETLSFSLATTQGFTACLGGALGGGMGGNIGLNSGLQYSQSKRFGQDTSNASTKQLSAYVDVKPNTQVIVRELVYEVEWAAMCELELSLRKEDKIKYMCKYGQDKEKFHMIEVNKLIKKALCIRRARNLDQQHSRQEDSSCTSPPFASLGVVLDMDSTDVEFTPHRKKPTFQLPTRKSKDMTTLLSTEKSSGATSEVQREENTPASSQDHQNLKHQKEIAQVKKQDTIPLKPQDPGMALALDKCVMLTENMIVITFLSDCLFNGEEHALEIIKLPSDPTRKIRIIDSQSGVIHQDDQENKMLSLKRDKDLLIRHRLT